MDHLQVCVTALLLLSVVWTISVTLSIKDVGPVELWIILAILSFIAGFVMCFVTYNAYQYSKMEKCQVTTGDLVYWTDTDNNGNKTAWVNLGDRRFCKIADERSFWAGIGNHMPYSITGVVESR